MEKFFKEYKQPILTITSSRDEFVERLATQNAIILQNAFEPKEVLSDVVEWDYVIQTEFHGKRAVRQQVAKAAIPEETPLHHFSDSVELQLATFLGTGTFATPLAFNDRCVQRYEDGSYGIAAHRDHSSNRNLIVLCGLQGQGRFTIYDDLEGRSKVHMQIDPGSVLLLAAPGFLGRDICPVHSVGAIRGQRYIVALRQNNPNTGYGDHQFDNIIAVPE